MGCLLETGQPVFNRTRLYHSTSERTTVFSKLVLSLTVFWLYEADSSETVEEQHCTLQEWVQIVTDTREKNRGVRRRVTGETEEEDKCLSREYIFPPPSSLILIFPPLPSPFLSPPLSSTFLLPPSPFPFASSHSLFILCLASEVHPQLLQGSSFTQITGSIS